MLTTILVIYIVLFLILIWFYSIYILLLEGFRTKSTYHHETTDLFISIIIPFYNEKDFAASKVQDLSRLNLDGIRHEIIFIDGGSGDGSPELIDSMIAGKNRWRLLHSPVGGKINQLNYAMSVMNPESKIIVNTDMDTELDSESVRELLKVLSSDHVGVAGAFVTPGKTIELDKFFWEDQNFVRSRESAFYSSSTVVAPLYAFKRDILKSFPVDCIADDVFVSFRANELGRTSVYVDKAKAIEVRGSSSTKEFILHKYRKGIANLRETFRFIKSSRFTHSRWKFIFFNRLCQLIFLPFVFFVFLGLTIYLLSFGDEFSRGTVLASVISGLILAEAAMKVKKRYSPAGGSTFHSILNLFISNMVLVVVNLTYPFVKQNSNYRKTS